MKQEVEYNGMAFEPFISNAEIEERIDALAKTITKDYKDKRPLFLCVLTGAFPFASDLFRKCEDINAEIAFIRLKSYEGTATSGKVKEVLGLDADIEGRDVIVVEDIVDTGRTIAGLLDTLRARNAANVRVATLLFKPDALKIDFKPDYTGFEIPSRFIVGFGLDIDGQGRNLNDIYVLKNK